MPEQKVPTLTLLGTPLHLEGGRIDPIAGNRNGSLHIFRGIDFRIRVIRFLFVKFVFLQKFVDGDGH